MCQELGLLYEKERDKFIDYIVEEEKEAIKEEIKKLEEIET